MFLLEKTYPSTNFQWTFETSCIFHSFSQDCGEIDWDNGRNAISWRHFETETCRLIGAVKENAAMMAVFRDHFDGIALQPIELKRSKKKLGL